MKHEHEGYEEIYQLYVTQLRREIERYKKMSKYLRHDNRMKQLNDQVIKILENKLDRLYDAKNKKEVKKEVHLDRIMKSKDMWKEGR